MLIEEFSNWEDFREASRSHIHWSYYIKKADFDYKLLVRFTSYDAETRHILRCDVEIGKEPAYAADSDNRKTIEAFRETAHTFADEIFPDSTKGEWKYE